MQRRFTAGVLAMTILCEGIVFTGNDVHDFGFFHCALAVLTPAAASLPRDAMHKRGLCRHVVSVRLSVSHVRTFCQNE